MDIGVGTGLAILGSKDLVLKILGPSADYIGQELRDWTESSHRNLRRVFEAAHRKLGTRADQPGSVPPRVLRGVLQEGAFSEDPMMADYLGGVLASSRSGVPRDDRGATLVALIGRLSTYDLRTHYILYTIAHGLLAGTETNLGDGGERFRKGRILVPFEVYDAALEFEEEENPEVLASQAIYVLTREELLEGWSTGPANYLRKAAMESIDTDGLLFQPTPLGIYLYLAAQGISDASLEDFLNPDHRFAREPLVAIPLGARRLAELPDPEL